MSVEWNKVWLYIYIYIWANRVCICKRCHNHVYNSHVSILLSMDVYYIQLSIDKVQVNQLRLMESKASVINSRHPGILKKEDGIGPSQIGK